MTATAAPRSRIRPPKPRDPRETALLCAAAAYHKKTSDLLLLDMRQVSSLADYFLLASARSTRQAIAAAEHMRAMAKKAGVKLLGEDGFKDGHWVLLDFGDVVAHIFYEPVRRFYDLESLWSDAPQELLSSETLRGILPEAETKTVITGPEPDSCPIPN